MWNAFKYNSDAPKSLVLFSLKRLEPPSLIKCKDWHLLQCVGVTSCFLSQDSSSLIDFQLYPSSPASCPMLSAPLSQSWSSSLRHSFKHHSHTCIVATHFSQSQREKGALSTEQSTKQPKNEYVTSNTFFPSLQRPLPLISLWILDSSTLCTTPPFFFLDS